MAPRLNSPRAGGWLKSLGTSSSATGPPLNLFFRKISGPQIAQKNTPAHGKANSRRRDSHHASPGASQPLRAARYTWLFWRVRGCVENVLHVPDEHGRSDFEDFGHFHERPYGRASKAALDQTDIRPVEIAAQPKLLLRYSTTLSNLAQRLSEGLLDSFGRLDLFVSPLRQHLNAVTLMTKVLRTIVRIGKRRDSGRAATRQSVLSRSLSRVARSAPGSRHDGEP